MINESLNATNAELISQAHKVVIPNVLITYVAAMVVFLLIGMFSISTKPGKTKFFWIWFSSSAIVGLVVAILIFFPAWIHKVFDFI